MDIINRSDATALIPEDSVNEIIQVATQNSVVMRLGRRVRDMASSETKVPVLETLPTAYFVGRDTGRIPTTKVEWGNKEFVAEKIAAIVPVPRDTLQDSAVPIWDQVRPLLGQAIGQVFDMAVLFGTNAPASWPDDLLTAATAASHTVDYSNAQGSQKDIYDVLLGEGGVASLVEQDGFAVTGWIADLSVKAKLRGLRGGDGHPVFVADPQSPTRYVLDGEPVAFAENGSVDPQKALVFAGDFRQLLWTLRRDMEWKLLEEAVIEDLAGNIVYNFATQDMVGLRVTMRLAWQVPNPVTPANQDAVTRFPFAVLVP